MISNNPRITLYLSTSFSIFRQLFTLIYTYYFYSSYLLTLNGISEYSSINIFSWLIQIFKSPSVNSYGILKPSGPNFLLSIITPWNKLKAKTKLLKLSVWKEKEKNLLVFINFSNLNTIQSSKKKTNNFSS